MIIKFENYTTLNEGNGLRKESRIQMFAMYLTLFMHINSDVNSNTKPDKFNYDFFIKYLNIMDKADKNVIIQEVIRDFKHKVINDPKILNKQEVLKVIDDTPILFRNDDKICYALYQKAKEQISSSQPSSWCTKITPVDSTKGKAFSVIFLSKTANYYEILHELSHAIETVVKIDPRIAEPFDFKMSHEKINTQLQLITNFSYNLKGPVQSQYLEYLSNPSEIFSRMNSFKMFLYRNKIIKTPNDELTELIFIKLMSGQIYKNLDDKAKKEFAKSDFLDLIIYLDFKKSPQLNQYVQNAIDQKKRGNMIS